MRAAPSTGFRVTARNIAVAAALMGAGLCGCSMSDEGASRFFVAPGKYSIYSCAQIADQMKISITRQNELEMLMARAGDDSAGRVVSDFAYKPEYISVKGEVRELRLAAIEKNCGEVDGVPGTPRASDMVIR